MDLLTVVLIVIGRTLPDNRPPTINVKMLLFAWTLQYVFYV